MCVTELVQLHDVVEALKAKGGRTLAICVDDPKDSKRVVENHKLNLSILADQKHEVIQKYGLVKPGAPPDAKDITVPAHVLIDPSGRIVWRYKSKLVQDRPDPAEIRKAIDAL